MAKAKDKVIRPTEAKDKETKDKEIKETKGKSNLVGRVKKVIKKSRRRLGEEKFEKELRRTIEFLAQLQTKLDASHIAKENGKAPAPVEKKPGAKAGPKVEKKVEKRLEKKAGRNASKKASPDKPDKRDGKKHTGNGVGKKRKGLQNKEAAPVSKPVAAPQLEAAAPKER